MKTRKLTLACALSLLAASTFAQEPKDEGYWLKDIADRIQINGYAQAGYTYTHRDGKNTNTLDVKRTLLWAKANVSDRWAFLIMHDFSSELQEFYTSYRITDGPQLSVRLGQFKSQLTLENVYSPVVCELIDVLSQGATYLSGCGSDPLFGIQYGRDLGIEFYGQVLDDKLFYNVQLLNGRGVNKKDLDNKKDIVIKLDYRPMEGLKLVTTAQKGYATAIAPSPFIPAANSIAVGETYRRDRWTAGAEYKTHGGKNDYWKDRCASVRGEVMGGKDGRTHSWGTYAVTSIPVVGQLDAVAAVDYFNYAKDYNFDQTNLALGVQYWYFRKCRLQLQYTWSDTWNYGTTNRIQIQTQVAF